MKEPNSQEQTKLADLVGRTIAQVSLRGKGRCVLKLDNGLELQFYHTYLFTKGGRCLDTDGVVNDGGK